MQLPSLALVAFGATEHVPTLPRTLHLSKAKSCLLEVVHVAISDEVAAAILAGFKQGVIAEAKRQSVMVGKEVVRELPSALANTGALVNQALLFVEETAEVAQKPKRRSRAARSADKKLSAAFKEANRRYRKKDGSLRTGRTQADIAKLAHKLRKKM